MTNIFKLAIIFITLLSILTLTACTTQTEKITTETSAVTNTAVTTADKTISENVVDITIKSEYNSYIILNTSISPDTEKNLTDIQRKHIEVILNKMDSTDKKIMTVLSLKKETADKENAPVFQADITNVHEFDGKTYAVRSYSVMGSSVMYDIWCTDGNTAEYIGDFTASEYVWQYPLKNGHPVIVSYEFYSRGHDYSKTPLIAADVYVIENGKLTECYPDDGKQFFWLCEFESTDKKVENRLFILDKLEDGYSIAPEDITELVQNGSFKQELIWSEGKLIAEKSIEESPQPEFKDNYDITDEELLKKFDEADTLFECGQLFFNDGFGNFYSKENETPLQYKDSLLNYFTEDCIDNFLNIYGIADTLDNGLYGNIIEFTINEDDKSYYISQYDMKETDFIKLDITDFSNLSDYDTILAGGQERTDISIMDYEILVKSREENKITLSLIVWHSITECELVPNETILCKLENGNIVYTGVYSGVDKDGNTIVSETELTGTINEAVTEDSYPEYLEKFDFYVLYDENREQWRFDCFHEWA